MKYGRYGYLACGIIGLLLGCMLTLYAGFPLEKGLADERPPITVVDIEYRIATEYETGSLLYEPNASGVFEILSSGWWQNTTDYEADVIPDAQKAVEVCQALFEGAIAEYYNAGSWMPKSVDNDSEAGLWVVSFGEFFEEDGMMHLTDESVEIVIQKKDGKVVRITGIGDRQ